MSSLDARVMPFGKHEGERIDTVAEIDPGWLRWVLKDATLGFGAIEYYPGLHDYIREALRRRGELNE